MERGYHQAGRMGMTYTVGVTPPVRIESSSSSVAEGQTLDLNCIVARQGQATVTWYKRGGSLPAKHQVGDTEEHLGVSGTRLRIPQVTAADSGEYVCRVMITLNLSHPLLDGADLSPNCSLQVSGTRLRIPQVTAADSGEYVCRVTSGGITQETSLIVTIDDGDNPSHCECHPPGGRFLLMAGTTGAIHPPPCPCSHQHQSTHPH
uniref:Ig-like domain-containing protein n=1 Tax=Catharus ustulatus TaxID=91951 RepID=A0A8C3UTG4_CATUS